MSFKSECEHVRECDDCRGQSGEINTAANTLRDWAGAIAELAVEAAREEDNPSRREVLLSGIGGLAFAIERLTEEEISGETLGPKDKAPRELEVVR